MKKLALSIFLIGFIIAFASLSLSLSKSTETSALGSYGISSENNLLFAASANCAPWNLQPDGCYERVCCCDNNGSHWCERCCPDKKGRCVAYRVKC